jgi:hypothetical protein
MQSPFTPPRGVTSFARAVSRRPPQRFLFDAFQRLLTAHRKPGLCVVCLPAISTFQRHSTQHLLHYWSPSSFHLVPVCRQLQRAYYLGFARVRAPEHPGVSLPVVFNVLGVALAA